MKAAKFDYYCPRSLVDATDLLNDDPFGNRVIAGGQSLGPMLNLRLVQPKCLIDVRKVPETTIVRLDNGILEIGACVTHAEIEDGIVPDITNGMMKSVAASIACRAIRNRGTVGGSITHADPAADWPVCFLVLGGEAVLFGSDGHRLLSLAEFLVGPFETAIKPGEILTGIRISEVSATARWGYYKFCRKAGEFPEAMAGVLLDSDRGVKRAVIGATESQYLIIENVFTIEDKLNAEHWASVIDQVLPRVDPYKRQMHIAALRRATLQAME